MTASATCISMAAASAVKLEGKPCDLIDRIAADPAFHLDADALRTSLNPENYIGCAALQTRAYLENEIDPLLLANAGDQVKAKAIEL